MKSLFLIVLVLMAARAPASEIIDIKLFDREVARGRLEVPSKSGAIPELVIFVPGTGPGTYLNRRKVGTTEFNYFDFFAAEFNKRGIAFFSYNKRGVTIGAEPPSYEVIDKAKYAKVVPSVEVKDIRTMVQSFRKDKRFAKAKIVLLGWSEGTILAPMAAEDKNAGIDAIFLAGYCNESMFDIIAWQNLGGSSMANLNPYFDADKDGRISKAEFISKDATPTAVRDALFKQATFEMIDTVKDGFLTALDFAALNGERFRLIQDAFRRGDDDWIWQNYFHITTAWLREHFALEANKTRLLRLNLPIYIFQGEVDANCPVDGARDIARRFELVSKSNLNCQIFAGHNHDLNYLDFITKKTISPGLAAIFDAAEKLAKD